VKSSPGFTKTYNNISKSINNIKQGIIRESAGLFNQHCVYKEEYHQGKYFYLDNKSSINPNNMKNLEPSSFPMGIKNGEIPSISTINQISEKIGVCDLRWRHGFDPTLSTSFKSHFTRVKYTDYNMSIDNSHHIGHLHTLSQKHELLFCDRTNDFFVAFGDVKAIKYMGSECYKLKNYHSKRLIILLLLDNKYLDNYIKFLDTNNYGIDIKVTKNNKFDVHIARIKKDGTLFSYGVGNSHDSALMQMLYHLSSIIDMSEVEVRRECSFSSSLSDLSVFNDFRTNNFNQRPLEPINQDIFKPIHNMPQSNFKNSTHSIQDDDDPFSSLHFHTDIKDDSYLNNANNDALIRMINQQNDEINKIRFALNTMLESNNKMIELLKKA